MTLKDNLADVLWEADRHLAVLTEALEEWNRLPAITSQLLESDHARVRIVDQMLFRFIKLQDTVGERLIPATDGYIMELDKNDWDSLKSKFSTSMKGGKVKLPSAFTEKGLYMIATILRSKQAIEAIFAIIETFSKMRED